MNLLPKNRVSQVPGNQLIGYGHIGWGKLPPRGKSCADFVAEIGIVEEECDEALYLDGDADRIEACQA